MIRTILLLTGIAAANSVFAQTREEQVRGDREKVEADGFWIYNDLPAAFAQAKRENKPIIVVLRCIPCHECVKLDDELVDKIRCFDHSWKNLFAHARSPPTAWI